MFDFNAILQRVTIRDILGQHGIYASKKRIPCPIHHGNNPTTNMQKIKNEITMKRGQISNAKRNAIRRNCPK